MANVRVLILRAPGTNCDVETSFAFEQAGAAVYLVHINELIRRCHNLVDFQVMVIPGGFTYGDDISAGKILANELRLKLAEDVDRFVDRGGLILGICNGFQVMVKAGILPRSRDGSRPLVTLTNNNSGKFECRWTYLMVNRQNPCVFTRGMSMMRLPVAHGEGKLVVSPEAMPGINAVLFYADETGNTSAPYPHNPNGSVNNIAGICDDSGRIFALMPHPERFVRWTQHPNWMREPRQEHGDGFQVFRNAVEWVRKA